MFHQAKNNVQRSGHKGASMAFGTLTDPTEILKVIDSNISSKSRHPASKRGLYSSGSGIIGVPIIMNPLI